MGAAGADVGVISAGVSFGEYGTGAAEIVAGVVGLISIGSVASAGRFFSNAWFGPRNLDVTPPKWLQGSWGSIAGIELPGIRIFIIILSSCAKNLVHRLIL